MKDAVYGGCSVCIVKYSGDSSVDSNFYWQELIPKTEEHSTMYSKVHILLCSIVSKYSSGHLPREQEQCGLGDSPPIPKSPYPLIP